MSSVCSPNISISSSCPPKSNEEQNEEKLDLTKEEHQHIQDAIRADPRLQLVLFPNIRKLRPPLKSISKIDDLKIMLLDPEPDDEKSALKTCLTCHFRHDGPMVGSRRRERHLCPVDPITQKVFVCRKWETCPTGWRTGHPNVDSKPQTVEAIEKKIKKLEKVVIKKQDEERKDSKKKYQLHSPILFKTELQDLCF